MISLTEKGRFWQPDFYFPAVSVALVDIPVDGKAPLFISVFRLYLKCQQGYLKKINKKRRGMEPAQISI